MNTLVETIKEKIPRSIVTDVSLRTLIEGTDDRRYGLVKRALKRGDLIQIRRGLYATGPKHRKTEINLFELAQKIYGPSYISLESALSFHGLIPEAVYSVTSVCLKRTKEFKTPLGLFTFTSVPQASLYEDVDRIEQDGAVFFMASAAKALLDMFYTHKKNWKTFQDAAEDLRIEKELLKKFDWKSFSALKKNYPQKSVSRFIDQILRKRG